MVKSQPSSQEAFENRLDQALEALWSGSGEYFDQLIEEDSGAGPPVGSILREVVEVSAANAVADRVGTIIGGFRITRELGRGGMGVVYEAESNNPPRRVALKVLRSGRFADEFHLRLFRREIRTLARLRHSGIAAIYETGTTELGEPFFVMELVQGVTLHEYVYGRKGKTPSSRLQMEERFALFESICEAINYAHQRGVIHRDLKPSNIIINEEATPKILDFGLARITDADMSIVSTATETGRIIGTLPYMSPELMRGSPDAIDLRSDVYSLGVILYELMTYHLPYDLKGRSLPDAARVICEQMPTRPGAVAPPLRGDAEWILLKALEKEPERRYQSAKALSDDLSRYLSGQPILARPPSIIYQLRKFIGRHKFSSSVILILLVLLTAAGIDAVVRAKRIATERDRALLMEQRAAQEATSARIETAKADQIRDFLEEMLTSVDPGSLGRDVTVREVLDRAAELVENNTEAGSEVLAAINATIGRAYYSLGLYNDAEPHLRFALEARREMLGSDHPDVAESLQMMGHLAQTQGDYARAISLQKEAVEIFNAAHGRDHLASIQASASLATALHVSGDLAAAKPIYVEALATSRELPDEAQEVMVGLISNLAQLHLAEGDYAAAEPLYREALALDQEIHGEEHIKTAVSLNNLAQLLLVQGEYEAAEPLLRQSLKLHKQHLGEEHVDVAVVQNNLAEALRDGGDYSQAEVYYRDALAILHTSFGSEHPYIALIQNNLAKVLNYQDKYVEAEQLYNECIAMNRKFYGGESLQVAIALNDYAKLLMRQERYTEAVDLFRQSLAIYHAQVGDTHPDAAGIANNLAGALCELGELEEAEVLCRKALKTQLDQLGNEHPNVTFTLSSLAKVLRYRQEYEAAEQIYREVLTIRRKTYIADHPDIVKAISDLAVVLMLQVKYDEAESMLLEAYTNIEQRPDASITVRRKLVKHLVELYETWNKHELATVWRTKLSVLDSLNDV